MYPSTFGWTVGFIFLLHHSAALGIRKIRTRSVQHLDDDEHIIYSVGQHISQYNYEKRSHRFFCKPQTIAQIFCFAVSHDNKYLALAEQVAESKNVQVSVYNFSNASRTRTLHTKDRKVPIIALAFSRDGKHIAAATDETDPSVIVWQVEKSKTVAHKKVSFRISQLSVNPNSNWQLASTSSDDLKIWRVSQSDLKHIDPVPNGKYLVRGFKKGKISCSSWFDTNHFLCCSKVRMSHLVWRWQAVSGDRGWCDLDYWGTRTCKSHFQHSPKRCRYILHLFLW